jgi:hypothetical protein
MSHGVGNYIRAITSDIQEKVTPLMRSFSTNFIYPTLTAELSKIHLELHPHFEFKKERDGGRSSFSRASVFFNIIDS